MSNERNLIIAYVSASKMLEDVFDHNSEQYITYYCNLFSATLGLARDIIDQVGVENLAQGLVSSTTSNQDSILMDIVWSSSFRDKIFEKLSDFNKGRIELNNSSLETIDYFFKKEDEQTLEEHMKELVRLHGLAKVVSCLCC